MENYVVQYGDTLKTIAKDKLGDENRWYEIAQTNSIEAPFQLYIAQTIRLPNKMTTFILPPPLLIFELKPATTFYGRGLLFIIFEQLPTIDANKVVRKISIIDNMDFSKHPNLSPSNPLSKLTEVQHVRNDPLREKIGTSYMSASESPLGSPTNVSELIQDKYLSKGFIPKDANPMEFVGQSQPVVIDLTKLPYGTRTVSNSELLGFLTQELKFDSYTANTIDLMRNKLVVRATL